jgi:eukaryotic-like serine/threonine-protein kinase
MSETRNPFDPDPASSDRPPTTGLRQFGRFKLRRLLGKSEQSMVWLVFDPRHKQDLLLTLPRSRPPSELTIDQWLRDAERAARVKHPHLTHVVEVDQQEHWPYVAVDAANGKTLNEWLAENPHPTPADAVFWVCQILEGLAFAHDAGVFHRDLQLHSILISERNQVRVMALEMALKMTWADPLWESKRNDMLDRPAVNSLNLQRFEKASMDHDVLSVAMLLHYLLCGSFALDESDFSVAIARIPPAGHERVQLLQQTPHPIDDALRAIVNRSTATQEKQRYLNARSFFRALSGWRESFRLDAAGPIDLMIEKVRQLGHLPAMPNVVSELGQWINLQGQRTDEIAEHILQDTALSLELIRQVNSAEVRQARAFSDDVVLTVRRAVALLGIEGIKRCSETLHTWPGPLSGDKDACSEMEGALVNARLAGHVAKILRPAGYDAEAIYLVTVLQNLGRLLVQYHFAEEAKQIRMLMQASHNLALEPRTEIDSTSGMSEAAAAYAVLGVDVETFGVAMARHWGLGKEIEHMIRALPKSRPVHQPDNDLDVIRAVASAANETVDAITFLSTSKINGALENIARRYTRLLNTQTHTLQIALQEAREILKTEMPPLPRHRLARKTEKLKKA